MRRFLPLFAIFAGLAFAANVKLYLKDGSYQIVPRISVQSDRVRYYSTERSDWEEMPLEMVDLKRTESEAAERQAAVEKEAKIVSEEEKAERTIVDEAAKIPQDPRRLLARKRADQSHQAPRRQCENTEGPRRTGPSFTHSHRPG